MITDDAQTRKDQDTKKVSEIFKHLGTKASVNNAIRLGKKGDKKTAKGHSQLRQGKGRDLTILHPLT